MVQNEEPKMPVKYPISVTPKGCGLEYLNNKP